MRAGVHSPKSRGAFRSSPRSAPHLELRDASHDVARHHSGEERPLVAETGIDRWLSRARGVGDFVDAGTFKSALHEYLARRIEDALVNLSKLLRLGGQRHA